jgi:hypothetical protein
MNQSRAGNCRQCNEDAIVISPNAGEFFVRVRRVSKCKNRKVAICQTPVFDNEQNAVSFWNNSAMSFWNKPWLREVKHG